METVKTEVELKDIEFSSTNEIFRKPHEISERALAELANSIREVGVLQSVLLRPKPGEETKYILIAGERRVRASRMAGKVTIPATVREVDEDAAVILQVTENNHREDVHELDEAVGYKVILEKNPTMTTKDLALKLGRSESYVVMRLKLNDLIKPGRKDFYEARISLGHAVMIARLTPEDQAETIKRFRNYNDGYGAINQLQQYIERNITSNLSQAPFNVKDETLLSKAGACTTCPKRSGASPLLFSEIKAKDKCFDRSCYAVKCGNHLLNKTKELVETQPDVHFLVDRNETITDEIIRILNEHTIKPLIEYDDFTTHKSGGKKASGFWISGTNAGLVVTVYVKTSKAVEEDMDSPKQQVTKIQQRLTRAMELDDEKVYAKILESLHSHPSQKLGYKKEVASEEIFLWFMVFDKAGFNTRREFMKSLKLSDTDPEKLYNALKSLNQNQRAYLLRRVIVDQYGGNYPRSAYAFIIKKIAKEYGDINIAQYENEQKEIRTKREGRAKEKVKQLKTQNKKGQ